MKKTISLIFFSLVPLFLHAQFLERSAPKEIRKEPYQGEIFPGVEHEDEIDEDRVIIEKTKGLVLYSNVQDVRAQGVEHVSGLEIENLTIPGTFTEFQSTLNPLYLDKPLSYATIHELKRAIILYYRKHHRPIVTVLLPEQNISTSILQLVVIEGTVGEVKLQNNKFFQDRRLREYVRLQEGGNIDADVLSEDLLWINRNPFREVDVVLKPGAMEGTTDVEFWIEDRHPLRIYVGVENSGLESSGRGRIFTGFNWGNAFGLDQILSYQFTKSTDWSRFYAHTGHWTIPLPWRHVLAFFGGYSKVHPKRPFVGTQTDAGRSVQLSMRYTVPFKPMRTYLHELIWGIDFKKTDINFIISDIPILANTAVITQLILGYNGSFVVKRIKTSFGVEVFWSPGDIFSHQSNSTYQELRPGAKSSYFYGKAFFLPIFELGHKFSLSFNTRYQLSSANLLSSEQLGLGGYDSVRGYDERDVNTDNGVLISTELRSPPLPVLAAMQTKVKDILQFLIFLDYGLGWNHNPFRLEGFEEERTQYLLSYGPGLRYAIGTNLTLRADWGIKLHKPKISTDQTNTRFHFGIMASY